MRRPLSAPPPGRAERAAVLALLAAAAALRLWNWDAGLPRLPALDENTFYRHALLAWEAGAPRVGWYGNPGTLLLWTQIPAVEAVHLWAVRSGAWDPALVDKENLAALRPTLSAVLRLHHMAIDFAMLALAAALGRVVLGPWGGVLSLAALAAAPVAVEHARVIRTDVPFAATVLVCQLAALAVLRRPGRRRDWVVGGALVGLSVSMRWFGFLAGAMLAGAWLQAGLARRRRRLLLERLPHLILAGIASVAAFAAVAPFVLQRHYTALRNLLHERRDAQLTATAADLPSLLLFYLEALVRNLGPAAPLLIVLGAVHLARARRAPAAVLAFPAAFAVFFAAQPLQWERWLIPVLPWLALLQAGGILLLARAAARAAARPGAAALLAAAAALCSAALPLAASARQSAELSDSAGDRAFAWMSENLPREARVLSFGNALEHRGPARVLRNHAPRPPDAGAAGASVAREALAAARGSVPAPIPGRDRGRSVPNWAFYLPDEALLEILREAGVTHVVLGATLASARAEVERLRGAGRARAREEARSAARFARAVGRLERLTEPAARFEPEPWRARGPPVEVRRLPPLP